MDVTSSGKRSLKDGISLYALESCLAMLAGVAALPLTGRLAFFITFFKPGPFMYS